MRFIMKETAHLIQLSQFEWRNCDGSSQCQWYFREGERKERIEWNWTGERLRERRLLLWSFGGTPPLHPDSVVVGTYEKTAYVQMFSTPLLTAIRSRRWKAQREVYFKRIAIGRSVFWKRRIARDRLLVKTPWIILGGSVLLSIIIDQWVLWRRFNSFLKKKFIFFLYRVRIKIANIP